MADEMTEQPIVAMQAGDPAALDIRAKIQDVAEKIMTIPGHMMGNCFPLTHSFGDGCYIREINMPKGHLVISKIHKFAHPYFVLKGDCSVLTEKGTVRIRAPYYGITPAGTQRALYIHEDTDWITVHVTTETDTDKIEDDVTVKSFDELLPGYVQKFIETEKARGG